MSIPNSLETDSVNFENGLKGRALEVCEKLFDYIAPLPDSCRLPSVKKLQEMFSAGQGTVIKALEALEKQGMLRRVPRKGIVVIKAEEESNNELDKGFNFAQTPWIAAPVMEATIALPRFATGAWESVITQFNASGCNRPVRTRFYENVEELTESSSQVDDDLVLFNSNPRCLSQRFDLTRFARLNEIITELDRNDFYEAAFHSNQSGRVWGIAPSSISTILLRDVFFDESNGAEKPSPEWTWEDLADLARASRKSEGTSYQYGFYFHSYVTFLFHCGARLINPETNRLELDIEQFQAPLNILKRLIVKDRLCPFLSDMWPHSEAHRLFQDHKIAMYESNSFQLARLNSSQGCRAVPLPLPLSGDGVRSIQYHMLCVNNTINFDASREFILYVLSKEGQSILAELPIMPIRKGIRPKGFTDEQYEIEKLNSEQGVVMPEDDFVPYQIRFLIETGIDRWLKYGGDLKKILGELEKSCQTRLDIH